MTILTSHQFPRHHADRTAYILGKAQKPLTLWRRMRTALLPLAQMCSIPCNTAHYFYDKLEQTAGVPILNMVEETVLHVKKRGVKKPALLATTGTVAAKTYQRMFEKHGMQFAVPDEAHQAMVMQLIYGDIKQGKRADMAVFEAVAAHMRAQGCDGAILGCTELSLIKRDEHLGAFLHSRRCFAAAPSRRLAKHPPALRRINPMCGFIGFSGQLAEKEAVLQRMMARIVHRGPDMGGAYVDEDVALGFRRLSILDLSEAGAQPMKSSDGNVVVTFNGEIYNFMELRRELEEKGHHFHCHADTEVLVHGYEEWGTQLVYRLRGMYGFVIWDKANRRLFGARDMFGIKPFYYSPLPDGKGLLFGSEIKGFLEHPLFQKAVNENALLPYLTLQYSATEETFFKGVYKLPAAHYFTYENGKMEIQRYWDCKFAPKEQSFDACADELDKTVHESVAAHRIADVKVGSFLSGGVDSSYITACLMPDNTFSVGFDYNKFNETNYAAELSEKLGVKNYRKLITAEECFKPSRIFSTTWTSRSRTCPACRCISGKACARARDGGAFRRRGDEILPGMSGMPPGHAEVKSCPARCAGGAVAAKPLPYFRAKIS
ncbi:MAG: asparagine synthase (glutamine-hydrolyzing) [Ruthenibacterium sp.]